MKKELLFAAVIMMMAAVSCGKENQNISGTDQMTSKLLLTATFESELTKTMLGEPSQGMIPVLWGGQDEIAVSGAAAPFVVKTMAPDNTSASFEGEVQTAAAYLAVYPYSATSDIEKDAVVADVTIPETQKAVSGTFDPAAHIAVAKTSDTSLAFRNVTAMVKMGLTAGSVQIASVTLEPVASDASMAGALSIDYTGETPSMTVLEGKKSVTIVPESGSIATGEYYFSIKPGAYAGIRTIFTSVDGKKAVVEDAATSFIFEASSVTGIGTVNVEDLHFASDSDVYYKVDLSSIDWDKSYVYYVVDASSNKVAMLTKEFFGATVNKQGIVVYPAVADGYDYTKGFVAQLTHDGTTTSVSGNVHGGSLSVTDMDDATVVYTDGRSAVPDAVYFDSDGNILKSKPALGTFNDYTVEALTVTSDVKTHGAVKLGTQIWLAEDYKTTKLSDGTSLNAYSAGDAMWDSSTTDKIVAIYTADTKSAYLYNAYALGYVTGATTLDDSNFAPQGWRLPTRAEYKDDMLGFCDNVYDYLKYRSLFGAELGYKSQGSSGKVKISQLAYTNSWTSTINEAGTKLYMCGLKTDGSVTDSPQNFTPTFGVRLIKE